MRRLPHRNVNGALYISLVLASKRYRRFVLRKSDTHPVGPVRSLRASLRSAQSALDTANALVRHASVDRSQNRRRTNRIHNNCDLSTPAGSSYTTNCSLDVPPGCAAAAMNTDVPLQRGPGRPICLFAGLRPSRGDVDRSLTTPAAASALPRVFNQTHTGRRPVARPSWRFSDER